MSKLEISTSIKFRKSIFSLVGSFMKLSIFCALIALIINQVTQMTGILVFVGLIVIGMMIISILWHYSFVKVKGNILEINNGFLFQQSKSFSMEYIQEINVKQSIVGRQLKYGDLIITAPTINESIVIKNLDSVWRLYKILNDYAQDQENEGFVITG